MPQPHHLLLREVVAGDLPLFYEHQADTEACSMAAFPSRAREPFFEHWKKILVGDGNLIRTIVVDGEVAGNICSWVQDGEREVGYWIGRGFWGRGIATQGLAEFLTLVPRPVYAHVARHNAASIRVLEKCGFTLLREEKDFSNQDGVAIEGRVYELQ